MIDVFSHIHKAPSKKNLSSNNEGMILNNKIADSIKPLKSKPIKGGGQ